MKLTELSFADLHALLEYYSQYLETAQGELEELHEVQMMASMVRATHDKQLIKAEEIIQRKVKVGRSRCKEVSQEFYRRSTEMIQWAEIDSVDEYIERDLDALQNESKRRQRENNMFR